MRVVFKKVALAEIEAIGDYVAQFNPESALNLVAQIRLHANMIGNFPQAYSIVSRYGSREIRRCVFGNYLIFYRIARSRVEVLQVIHGATSPAAWRF